MLSSNHYRMFLFVDRFSSYALMSSSLWSTWVFSLRLIILTLIYSSPIIVFNFSFTEEITVKHVGAAAVDFMFKKKYNNSGEHVVLYKAV